MKFQNSATRYSDDPCCLAPCSFSELAPVLMQGCQAEDVLIDPEWTAAKVIGEMSTHMCLYAFGRRQSSPT